MYIFAKEFICGDWDYDISGTGKYLNFYSWVKLVVIFLVIMPLCSYSADVVWSGGATNNNWNRNLNWSGWDGDDNNLNDGDIIVYNDSGQARTTSRMDTVYFTEVGGVRFEENTSYTLSRSGNFELIIQDGGFLINNTSMLQTIDIEVEGRGNELYVDSGTVAGGKLLFNNSTSINLSDSSGVDLKVSGANEIEIEGKVTGTEGKIIKDGSGTLILSGANTYTGDTEIKDGTLKISADNRISDSSDIILSGGTFNTGGFDETVGNLSLTSDSIIDMLLGTSILNFDGFSDALIGTNVLKIHNWTGTVGAAGGTDQLVFSNHSSFNKFSQVQFYSDGGLTFLGSSQFIGDELVPGVVPEASTWVGIISLLLCVGWYERKRIIAKKKCHAA